jgi:RHS repeat-associated protein
MAGGGTRLFKDKGYDAATGVFAPDPKDMSVLKRVSDSPPRYERRLNDGSVDIYAHSDGKGAFPRRVFLTEQRDPAGNALKYQYDGKNRLVSVIDASGQKTTLEYQHPDPLKITGIQDPAGRRAQVAYDGQGRLVSITDAVGLVSKVGYRGGSTFVERLETPYGVTRFDTGEDAHSRWVEVTDPLGQTARVESRWGEAPVAATEKEVPMGINLLNRDLNRANTFYWDAIAYAQHKGDYTKAQAIHWLIEDGQMVDIAASAKLPLESRVWYSYQGQTSAASPGSCARPSTVARVLPDGSTQLEQTDYNPLGQMTRHVDPLGRETQYEYAANGIDLLKVRQKNGDRYDTLQQLTWDGRHRPLAIKDAAGQTTQYTYNAAGQLTGQSNALGAKKEYRYDGQGRLVAVINPLGNVEARYTWDAAGNLASETDSGGYTLSYAYDALGRLTRITYPDKTAVGYTWDKLDLAEIKERDGALARYQYDAARNRIVQIGVPGDIHYGYDANGQLIRLTDGKGQLTQWERDLQGRIIAKTAADGARTAYEYDSAGRQVKRTDALGQERLLSWGRDDHITGIHWRHPRARAPEVRFTWDAAYPRIAAMADGTGETRYRYLPVGRPGALRLAARQGPGGEEGLDYRYDALGRLQGWSLGGIGESYAFDALGRLAATQNTALGQFQYGYVGDGGMLASVALSGSALARRFSYEPDGRLQAIHNPSIARSYRYETSLGNLITRQFEAVQGRSRLWQYGYDAVGRLQSAQRDDGKLYRYALDDGDNLVGIVTPEGEKAYEPDAGNKIRGYRYDANGSRVEDERHAYQWDAENRLIKITYKANPQKSTEFKYDGLGRRVAAIETDGGVRAETRYAWCGNVICQARDAQNRPIAYYYGQGAYRPQEKSKREYYAKDHLGSIRDVLDEKGQALARYDYEPYGKLASGPEKKPEFGYAGMHYHAPSGLYLTKYRAYDPQSGRWLSRDPMGEAGGINLYAYVEGNPLSYTDPLGLQGTPVRAGRGGGGRGGRGGRENPYIIRTNYDELAEHLNREMVRLEIPYMEVRAPGGTPSYTYRDVRNMERTLENRGYVRTNPDLLFSSWTPNPNPDMCVRPGARPSWRQSERDAGRSLSERFGSDVRPQVSYRGGREVPGGRGSVRPDITVTTSEGVITYEVKNYNIATNSSGLIYNVSQQAITRAHELPEGTQQRIIIDIRGQTVTTQQIANIQQRIEQRTGGGVTRDQIQFLGVGGLIE